MSRACGSSASATFSAAAALQQQQPFQQQKPFMPTRERKRTKAALFIYILFLQGEEIKK